MGRGGSRRPSLLGVSIAHIAATCGFLGPGPLLLRKLNLLSRPRPGDLTPLPDPLPDGERGKSEAVAARGVDRAHCRDLWISRTRTSVAPEAEPALEAAAWRLNPSPRPSPRWGEGEVGGRRCSGCRSRTLPRPVDFSDPDLCCAGSRTCSRGRGLVT